MNNFNIPSQFIHLIKGGNPQQIAMNFLQQNSKNNPMFENLMNLANNGNGAAVEEICRNAIKSKGLDPDELMNNFKKQFQ